MTTCLPPLSQEDGGVYSCTADNGVGSPAEALVNLQVLCKYSFPLHSSCTAVQQTMGSALRLKLWSTFKSYVSTAFLHMAALQLYTV